MNGALRIKLAPIAGGDEFFVVAGMVEARKWERKAGKSVAKELEEFTASTIVELAHLAYVRRNPGELTIEEFEDRFDVLGIDAGGEAPEVPSDPATAPPSD